MKIETFLSPEMATAKASAIWAQKSPFQEPLHPPTAQHPPLQAADGRQGGED